MRMVKALLKSRKFWIAVGDVLIVVLVKSLGLNPEAAEAIVGAAVALGMALIAGITIEDAAEKLGWHKKE